LEANLELEGSVEVALDLVEEQVVMGTVVDFQVLEVFEEVQVGTMDGEVKGGVDLGLVEMEVVVGMEVVWAVTMVVMAVLVEVKERWEHREDMEMVVDGVASKDKVEGVAVAD
jgi:hypothetical protein